MLIAARSTPYQALIASAAQARSGARREQPTPRAPAPSQVGTIASESHQPVNGPTLVPFRPTSQALSSLLAALDINARFDAKADPAESSAARGGQANRLFAAAGGDERQRLL